MVLFKSIFFKTLLALCLLVALSLGALLFLVLECAPSVAPLSSLDAIDLHSLEFLSADNDPRALAPGSSATLALSKNDLELALNYLLDRLQLGQAKVALQDGSAQVEASLRVPVNFAELYLTLKGSLEGGGTLLIVSNLSVGGLRLPDWLSAKLLSMTRDKLDQRYPDYQRLRASIENLHIDARYLRLSYRWDPALARDLSRWGSELLLPHSLRDLLAVYRARLRELALEPNLPKRPSADEFLPPMFAYAHNRGGDPVEENRALLLALTLYALDLDRLTLNAADQAAPWHELQFYHRGDWSRHFFLSIGLTLGGGAGLAGSIGLLKEIEDTHGKGSGFSFTDIGADRMGVRFAEFAVSNPANARLLQQRMAQSEGEPFYFPDLRDLPEFLSQEQFAQDYGGTTGAAFKREIDQIEARIDALPVFAPAL
ncbi:MAG: hypothetical protein LBE21_07605 [Pseudomonadales bacterium]|jgi:hypothetical protein|nr:hypothetical protein [Pseudomonadales bacterium]